MCPKAQKTYARSIHRPWRKRGVFCYVFHTRRLLDGTRCLPFNTSGHEGEFLRGQVPIAQHHLVRLPSAQFHQLQQRSAALHVPRGPGVPQVVEAEVLDAGTLLRLVPRGGALLDALTCKGQAPARVANFAAISARATTAIPIQRAQVSRRLFLVRSAVSLSLAAVASWPPGGPAIR